MKLGYETAEYQLTPSSVDFISERVHALLTELGLERRNVLHMRLSIENILLSWSAFFDEGTPFTFTVGSKLGRPYIEIALRGPSCNPIEDDADFGEMSVKLLASLGLSPSYAYQNGVNRVTIKLKKKRMSPLKSMLIAVIGALVLGFLGLMLPDATRLGAVEFVLTPLYKTFLGILATIASPMIFLSVAWGIYGVGDVATFGRIGKRLLLRFVGITFLVSVVAATVLLPLYQLEWSDTASTGTAVAGIFNMVLDIFPENIMSPFLEGNTMQVILIAAVVGSVMLILGAQTKVVATLIEQINHIIHFLMEMISSMVPAFIFIVLLRLIWSGSFDAIATAWKPLAFFLLVALLWTASVIALLCFRKKVKPAVLLRKMFPTFLIALTTASSSAAFGTNVNCCEKDLGISNKLTNFGIPIGIVLYAPMTAISFLSCAFYSSEMYGVEISFAWLIMAVVVVSILTVAMPPIPGGALACYTIIYSQLGIPLEALEIILMLDVIFDFLATGLDMTLLQGELVFQADSLKLLDKEKLRTPLAAAPKP